MDIPTDGAGDVSDRFVQMKTKCEKCGCRSVVEVEIDDACDLYECLVCGMRYHL